MVGMSSHTACSGGQIRGVERGQLADKTEAYTGIVFKAKALPDSQKLVHYNSLAKGSKNIEVLKVVGLNLLTQQNQGFIHYVRYHDLSTCNKTTVCLLEPKSVLSLTQGGCFDTADRPHR